MSGELRRSNLPDLELATALPAIKKVIEEQYMGFQLVGPQVFNVEDMDSSIVQHSQVSALQVAGQVAEGAEYPIDRIRQGYNKTYLAVKYGILLPITQEMIDDDNYNVLKKNPRRLARSFASAQEIDAAAIFNTAFTTAGPDGKTLCATDHPALSPSAPTISNRLAVDADLSITSLQDSITLMRKTTDTSGNKIMIKPKRLLVPAALEFKATELLDSVMKPENSTNDVNAVNTLYGMSPLVWDYLTDDDAFFLVADKVDHDLYWYWRKMPAITTQEEFKTDVALTKMSARWTVGYSDFRGVVGTPGA